jgi:hypothetical protein
MLSVQCRMQEPRRIDLKENKSAGSENCLDPPSAELLAWPEMAKQIAGILVLVRREGNFIDYHVVALSHVVNVNL